MGSVDLVNHAPAARLMLMGVVVAMGPLVWVWLRSAQARPAERLRRLTLVTLFLTFDLVLFGAFTRLTDSGLGCPDWPGCYGSASPVGAHAAIGAAQAAMPTGPVTFTKAWIEMIHRYLATGVGVLILVMALVAWVERRRIAVHWGWPLLTLFWVCLQGAFGALTVTMKLFPAIVTMHLLGGMVLLALLQAQAARYRLAAGGDGLVPPPETAGAPDAPGEKDGARLAGVRRLLLPVLALLWLQIALGGWVSTNYAVLACQDFPTCQGAWWPVMDFAAGFEWWRELGERASGDALPFAALTAIHYVHRLVAYALLVALLGLAWTMRRAGLSRQATLLLALAGWQLASGLSNVVLGWPLLAAVAHTAGAAALVVAFTGWLVALGQPLARGAARPDTPAAAHRATGAGTHMANGAAG